MYTYYQANTPSPLNKVQAAKANQTKNHVQYNPGSSLRKIFLSKLYTTPANKSYNTHNVNKTPAISSNIPTNQKS